MIKVGRPGSIPPSLCEPAEITLPLHLQPGGRMAKHIKDLDSLHSF